MDRATTLWAMAAAAVVLLAGLAGGTRRRAPGKVSLVPWGALVFGGLTLLLLAGVHLPSVWRDG